MTIIRRLSPEDDPSDLIELSREFFDEYSAYHEEFFQIDQLRDEDIVGYFSQAFHTENGAAFIAIENGKMVGYITVYIRQQAGFMKIKQAGEISGFMVQKGHRRRGIGTRLMLEARKFLQEKGIKYYTLYTATMNQGALKFYEHEGMKPLRITLLGKTAGEKE